MPVSRSRSLESLLQPALEARWGELCENRQGALRLFAGFYEGDPDLVVDLYANTLVIYDYHEAPEERMEWLDLVQAFYLRRLPWVQAAIRKLRFAPEEEARRGRLSYGHTPAAKISEHGIWYALDLTLQQDASFYLDTRLLRRWLLDHASGWRVLNTFAYTGSLGVAALAGGASRVIQTDRNRKFLALARRSAMLNHLDLGRMKFWVGEFFGVVACLKRLEERFDCVILDPPFFSTSPKGTIDQLHQHVRLINKLRPLVRDGGWLVAINNALYLSGAEYYRNLEALCREGYLSIETLIPVPPDITGYAHTTVRTPPADPAPFNHATKIAVLRVFHPQKASGSVTL